MFKCNDCGRTFREDEIVTFQDYRGEFWGQPCSETCYGCPHCKSEDFEKVSEDGEADDDGTD